MAPIVYFNRLKEAYSSVEEGSDEDRLVIDNCLKSNSEDIACESLQDTEHHHFPQMLFEKEESQKMVECKPKSEHEKSIQHNTGVEKDSSGFFKRHRTVFSLKQLMILEEAFKKSKFLTRTEKAELSKELNLQGSTIKVWFQNRRMRDKRSKCDELSSPSNPVIEQVPSAPTMYHYPAPQTAPFPSPYMHPYSAYQLSGCANICTQPCPAQSHSSSSHYRTPHQPGSYYATFQPHCAFQYNPDHAVNLSETERVQSRENSSVNARSPIIHHTPFYTSNVKHNGMEFGQGHQGLYEHPVNSQISPHFYHARSFDYGCNSTILPNIAPRSSQVAGCNSVCYVVHPVINGQVPSQSSDIVTNYPHYSEYSNTDSYFNESADAQDQASARDAILGLIYLSQSVDGRQSAASSDPGIPSGNNFRAERSKSDCNNINFSMTSSTPEGFSPKPSTSGICQSSASKTQSDGITMKGEISKQDIFRPYI